jgi:hypothetical protein
MLYQPPRRSRQRPNTDGRTGLIVTPVFQAPGGSAYQTKARAYDLPENAARLYPLLSDRDEA